jgi:uroporphyrinogen decarboxylase
LNSKDIVIRSLEFKYPDRVPLMLESCGYTDVLNLFIRPDKDWRPNLPEWSFENNPGKYIDEWGCIWTVTRKYDMGQVTCHPLTDLSKIKYYKFPNPDAGGRFKEAYKVKQDNNKYKLFWIVLTLFERLYMLHGFSETLIDIKTKTKDIEGLLDIILDFNLKIIEKINKAGVPVDGIGITDDWGTEQSLFIAPELWRKLFKKRYKKLVELCHRYGLHLWMHSDGKINEIMNDLIEIGIDAINLNSPELLGIEEVGNKWKGVINFFSSIDTQKTLVYGNEKEIREEFEKVAFNWGSSKGGLIIYLDDGNYNTLGVNDERKKKVCKILQEYKNYYQNINII